MKAFFAVIKNIGYVPTPSYVLHTNSILDVIERIATQNETNCTSVSCRPILGHHLWVSAKPPSVVRHPRFFRFRKNGGFTDVNLNCTASRTKLFAAASGYVGDRVATLLTPSAFRICLSASATRFVHEARTACRLTQEGTNFYRRFKRNWGISSPT